MARALKREDVYIQWLPRGNDGRVAIVRVSDTPDHNPALTTAGRKSRRWLLADGETPEDIWRLLDDVGFVDDAARQRAQQEFDRIEGFVLPTKEGGR
jgi:hypothetical protein